VWLFFTETLLPKIDGIVTVTCLLLDHLEQRGIETVIVTPRMVWWQPALRTSTAPGHLIERLHPADLSCVNLIMKGK